MAFGCIITVHIVNCVSELCVQIGPHWSSLTNLENLRSGFRPSRSAVGRSKENNGNCKAFCILVGRRGCADLQLPESRS